MKMLLLLILLSGCGEVSLGLAKKAVGGVFVWAAVDSIKTILTLQHLKEDRRAIRNHRNNIRADKELIAERCTQIKHYLCGNLE